MFKPDLDAVNKAFSQQSTHFDMDDAGNPILQDLRKQVYAHLEKFIRPNSKILELNAGTGIDAEYFISKGHAVHAIDISEGMLKQHRKKIDAHNLNGRWVVEKLSFTELGGIEQGGFDFVFSNFGGLNCVPDLKPIFAPLPRLLKLGGYVTLVVMPPVYLWEMVSSIKGNLNAFRRLKKNGVMAHLDGVDFRTWYHSFRSVKKAMGKQFKLVKSEGLATISPPPHAKKLANKHPGVYNTLRSIDASLRNHFPFNRWADHLILTFQYKS